MTAPGAVSAGPGAAYHPHDANGSRNVTAAARELACNPSPSSGEDNSVGEANHGELRDLSLTLARAQRAPGKVEGIRFP